jgi:hypothetical protein
MIPVHVDAMIAHSSQYVSRVFAPPNADSKVVSPRQVASIYDTFSVRIEEAPTIFEARSQYASICYEISFKVDNIANPFQLYFS